MTPKERAERKKMLGHLDNVVSIASNPGNAHATPYMLGMANGLILAQAIVTNGNAEYLSAPETFLADRPKPATQAVTDTAAKSRDIAAEVAALVGLWIERQQAAGQTAVDLNRVKDVRAGIELALT